MESLAIKYRPKRFEDVVGQDVTIKILSNQIKNNSYSHAILFTGNAGCGKTTCARIFANMIDGEILELDCASHNGVAEIKEIVDMSRTKPLIHEYKVIILDECHTLTSQAWASLLIVLEEKLPNTIFIFCTTDTQKIPNTIMSRVQRFNFLPITNTNIYNRIYYICSIENIDIQKESLNYIVKSANGSLRQALTNLDKCISYGDFSIDSVCKVLNLIMTDVFDTIYTAFTYSDRKTIIDTIENVYNNGYNLHQFVRQFLDYCTYKTNFNLLERLLIILQDIRYDDSPKNIIIARLII